MNQLQSAGLLRAPARRGLLLGALLLSQLLAMPAQAKMSVFDSPHNLSASGGRGRASKRPGVTFSEQTQVCIFCHVPHNALSGSPLWSRELATDTTNYTVYSQTVSSTLVSSPNRPSGASRFCLSCHDGTIALAKYKGSKITLDQKMPVDLIPGASAAVNATVNPNLTLDLSNSHPISFAYTAALVDPSQVKAPASLPPEVRLEHGVNLECTACHDPHDNQFGNFLVMNNGSEDPTKTGSFKIGSPLCTACHNPKGWADSSHNNPSVTSLGHGCLSCHRVHSAPGAVRLLSQVNLEDNCLVSCHNGVDPDSRNVKPLFDQSMHRHPIDIHSGNPATEHDEREKLPAQNAHVQCVDCHNPHQVSALNAPLSRAPNVDGRIQGVRMDNPGNPAQTEYDVCLKCHGGKFAYKFYGYPEALPNRLVADSDQTERFNPLNPSYHPVVGNRLSNGASLLTDYRPNMVRIYCIDCHNSDQGTKAGGSGANGPHGSQYPHILIARYEMPLSSDTPQPYSTGLYALCYRCHSEDYLLTGNTAFKDRGSNLHASHLITNKVSCFACHDPHGASKLKGASAEHNSHLVNFDLGLSTGALVAIPQYTTFPAIGFAAGSGTCTVNCHSGAAGTTRSYGPGSSAGKRALSRQRSVPAGSSGKAPLK
jgi:hypothetical protein